MLLAFILLPTLCGLEGARREAAVHLLSQLQLAVESYEQAFGEYPPGDGSGTRELLRAVQRPRRGQIWQEPDPEPVIEGDLRNPLQPHARGPEGVVRYRRHPPGSAPPYSIFVSDGRGGEIRVP